jgi:hypothetical protein
MTLPPSMDSRCGFRLDPAFARRAYSKGSIGQVSLTLSAETLTIVQSTGF